MTTQRLLVAAIAASLVAHVAAAQTIHGTIVDSASGKGVARARVGVSGTALQTITDSLGRFTIASAPSGEQMLAIHTPSLDSLNAGYSAPVTVGGGTTNVAVRVPSALQIAATACGDRGFGSGGIILGRLRVAEDSTASLAGTVSAEWKAISRADSSKWVSAMSDARGRFALCGVPLEVALSLRAATDGASGQSSDVRVASAARFGRTEIVLHRVLATTATLAGLVTDSMSKPINGAEVTLPDLGKGTATDEQGAFVLRDVPAGTQHVLVRHVGFGPVEAQLKFAGGQTIQRHITMVRSTTLDSVVVQAKSVDHALDDFEANRKLGLGHFLTRAELAPQESRSTGAVVAGFPGIRVYTSGPYAWVTSGHGGTTLTGSMGIGLDRADVMKQAPVGACYALIYMDNQLVWRGQKFPNPPGARTPGGSPLPSYTLEPLFDINTIPVAAIEAIEYYATPAQTPMKYAGLNSECGVLVIHTLRFHPKDTTSVAPNPPASSPAP